MNIILQGILITTGITILFFIIWLLIPEKFKKIKKFIEKIIDSIATAFP